MEWQQTVKETVMLGPVLADRERLDTLWDCDTGVMLRATHAVGGRKTVQPQHNTLSKQSHSVHMGMLWMMVAGGP